MAQTSDYAAYGDPVTDAFRAITIAAIVYPFSEAPQKFRELSTNGGDEDWIIVCGRAHADVAENIANRLAVCDYDKYETENEIVFITCHA